MKRPTLFFVASLLYYLSVKCQDQFMRDAAENGHGTGTQQFSIGYGYQTIQLINEGNAKTILPPPGSSEPLSISSTGAISFSYLNDVFGKFAWGFKAAYEQISTKYPNGDNPAIAEHTQYVMVMPDLQYRYINHEKFQLYSGIAAGVYGAIANNSLGARGNKINLAYQGTGIGFRCGNNFAFFGEFGYGNLGVVHGGLSCRF